MRANLGVVCALAVAGAVPAIAAEPVKANEQILALAKERLAIVTQLHEMTLAGYRVGTTSLSEVLEARQSLASAKLDLCQSKEERVKVFEEMVQIAEQTIDLTERLARAGETPQYKVLQAKAHFLQARINLEREKVAP